MTIYLSCIKRETLQNIILKLLGDAKTSSTGQSQLQTHFSTQHFKTIIIVINRIEKGCENDSFICFLY